MKQQIIIIHGGDAFGTYREFISSLGKRQIDFEWYRAGESDWKRTLGKTLGKKFEVILPDMPNKANAKYLEWKIWFEKFIPYIKSKVILIGHSLGGIFLAKYLSENKFPKMIKATFLIAAPYNDKNSKHPLADFVLPKDLKGLQKQGGDIFIYHSKNDPAVPFADSKKYLERLKGSTSRAFANKGHFNQRNFVELVKNIKNL